MNLSEEIKKIKDRNLRVEADKAWETSATRKAIIAVLTYFVIVLIFLSLNAPRPWMSALIPTVGFLLSTGSLPFFKKLWLERIYERK